MPAALHIFDCDGVLVDSEVIVTRIESQLLRDVGVELTPESIAEAFVGLSEAEMHGRIEADWGVKLPEDFGSRKAALLDEVFRTELRAVPGISHVLEELDALRCVASSSAPDRIRTSLAVTGLEKFSGPCLFGQQRRTGGLTPVTSRNCGSVSAGSGAGVNPAIDESGATCA